LNATALGWLPQPNLEILVEFPASDPYLLTFEEDLFTSSICVDRELFEQIQQTVELIAPHYPKQFLPEFELTNLSELESTSDEVWLPTLRNPEDLYPAYCGDLERLSSASRNAALADLRSLRLPPHLPKPAFEACIGTLLLQKPILRKVDTFLVIPRRFGAVTDLLASLPCSQTEGFDSDRTWQTLMRWLRYFLPNRYALSVPNYSEVFYRIDPKANDS
jgi:hypothetical protein